MSPLVDDRYELLEVIASGGMATVWRARDTRLDRQVALKRPHPGAGDGQWRERLEREAHLAAGISHPNLVTVFDTGSDDDGPFLVMELVEGPTLAEAISSNSVGSAATMGAQLAAALAAVHAAGIVHRDIKPANIMLGDDGPRLTDFGIARRPADLDQLTVEGTIVATPSYAAPEVLTGAEPTPAGDVFALGAVIYEMTSGSPAFRGVDRTSPPPLPDPELDRLIRSALDSDPARRPTASALADTLERPERTFVLPAAASEGQPTDGTTAVPPTVGAIPEAPERRLGRRWLVPALAGTALIVLIAALVLAWGDPDPDVPSEPAASQPLSAATAVATTTSPATTGGEQATTQAPPTTEPPVTGPPDDPLETAVSELARLEGLVLGLRPEDVQRNEQERMLAAIAGLEEAVRPGDDDDDDDDDDGRGRGQAPNVAKLLDDLGKGIGRIDDPGTVAEAQASLDRLRGAIDELDIDDSP